MTKTTESIISIGVIGSRNITDFYGIEEKLDAYIKNKKLSHPDVRIVSGGAKGVDTLAKKYHIKHQTQYLEFLPEWNKYGDIAGHRRNTDIVNNSDIIIAFWDGVSRGTLDSINKIIKNQKKFIIYIYINDGNYLKIDRLLTLNHYLFAKGLRKSEKK